VVLDCFFLHREFSFRANEHQNIIKTKSQQNQFKTTKKDHDAFKMNQGYGGGGGQNPQDKKRIREAEMRKLYANSWAVELMKAPCATWILSLRFALFAVRCLATEEETDVRVVARVHVL
jgi:hypothetical protein